MAENGKVRFGLSKLYYAVLTEGSTNAWATPVAIPGAVSMDIADNGSSNTFYADNIVYYKSISNNGYTGSVEVAQIPDKMLTDVWGMTINSDGVLVEKTGVQPKPIALLFQVDTDGVNELNLFYRVVPTSKPTSSPATVEDSVTPFTTSFDFEALPLVTGSSAQLDLIKAKTTPTTSTATVSGWFGSVYTPAS